MIFPFPLKSTHYVAKGISHNPYYLTQNTRGLAYAYIAPQRQGLPMYMPLAQMLLIFTYYVVAERDLTNYMVMKTSSKI